MYDPDDFTTKLKTKQKINSKHCSDTQCTQTARRSCRVASHASDVSFPITETGAAMTFEVSTVV